MSKDTKFFRMMQLNLPEYDAKIKEENGKRLIFDPLRRRYVSLSPEEWVRQHFVNYLLTRKTYPAERICNEVSIRVNTTVKRCDTVVYDNYLTPRVIIEYKAPDVIITEEVFNQITRYNYALTVPYLIVSNGISHYCCHVDYCLMKCTFLQDVPDYNEVCI